MAVLPETPKIVHHRQALVSYIRGKGPGAAAINKSPEIITVGHLHVARRDKFDPLVGAGAPGNGVLAIKVGARVKSAIIADLIAGSEQQVPFGDQPEIIGQVDTVLDGLGGRDRHDPGRTEAAG